MDLTTFMMRLDHQVAAPAAAVAEASSGVKNWGLTALALKRPALHYEAASLGYDSIGKHYRSYLQRLSRTHPKVDLVLAAALHFAASQRDHDVEGPLTPLAVLIGPDRGLAAPLASEFQQLRLCAIATEPAHRTPEKTKRLRREPRLTKDLVDELSADHALRIFAIIDPKSIEDLDAQFETISCAADPTTLALFSLSPMIASEFVSRYETNKSVTISAATGSQAGRVLAIEGLFKDKPKRYRDPRVLPALQPQPRPKGTEFLEMRRTRALRPLDAITPATLRATKDDSYVVLREAFEHRSRRQASVFAAPYPPELKPLLSPNFHIKRLTLSVLPKATCSGGGFVITQDNGLHEESLPPVIDHGEYTTWGRKYSLGQQPDAGHIGFIDKRIIDEGQPGKFRIRHMPKIVREIDGPVLIAGALYHAVFSHWLIDVMSKLALLPHLRAAGVEDLTIVVSGPLNEKMREMLRFAGVDLAKVIELDRHDWIAAETLLVPSRPARMYDFIAPEVFSFYDAMCDQVLAETPVNPANLPRRIYTERQKTQHASRRRLVNEDLIIETLERQGFKPVEFSDLSLAEEIALFRNAEMIAAPHGSALGGIMFMPPGAKVCCFFARSLLRVIRHHYTITANRDLDLVGVLGDAFGMRSDMDHWVVDPDLLNRALDA
ncbi:MAG: glycosyltransferase family 61 protein [Pseudomonadota bacterium]